MFFLEASLIIADGTVTTRNTGNAVDRTFSSLHCIALHGIGADMERNGTMQHLETTWEPKNRNDHLKMLKETAIELDG